MDLTLGDGIALFGVCGTIISVLFIWFKIYTAKTSNGNDKTKNPKQKYVTEEMCDLAHQVINSRISTIEKNIKEDITEIKENQKTISSKINSVATIVAEIKGHLHLGGHEGAVGDGV